MVLMYLIITIKELFLYLEGRLSNNSWKMASLLKGFLQRWLLAGMETNFAFLYLPELASCALGCFETGSHNNSPFQTVLSQNFEEFLSSQYPSKGL